MMADVASCVLTYTYIIKETKAAILEVRHNKSSKIQPSQLHKTANVMGLLYDIKISPKA
jgi:hypothetical protein